MEVERNKTIGQTQRDPIQKTSWERSNSSDDEDDQHEDDQYETWPNSRASADRPEASADGTSAKYQKGFTLLPI
jgi:hypothetical protein